MKTSAGLLPYRIREGQIEVLLGHVGGPWFANKDRGGWSVIKGEYDEEDPIDAAKREFKEETSLEAPGGKLIELGEVKQKSGKVVKAWAIEADLDTSSMHSNMAKVEWPPRSGQMKEYPETDRFEYFELDKAAVKIIEAQTEFLDRLADQLGYTKPSPPEQSSLF